MRSQYKLKFEYGSIHSLPVKNPVWYNAIVYGENKLTYMCGWKVVRAYTGCVSMKVKVFSV